MAGPDVAGLGVRARTGEAAAVGRLLSLAERGAVGRAVAAALAAHAGRAQVMGLTDSSGSARRRSPPRWSPAGGPAEPGRCARGRPVVAFSPAAARDLGYLAGSDERPGRACPCCAPSRPEGQAATDVEAIVLERMRARIGDVRSGSSLRDLAERVAAGGLDPSVAADELEPESGGPAQGADTVRAISATAGPRSGWTRSAR